ncbi:hypothetical protein IAD21_04788 [Abditibacteriota bacterium]|nr:hypothetical protein IAD21_04788 [Abditibacteriota bacterium]
MTPSFTFRRALCSVVFAATLSTTAYAQEGTAPANQDGDPATAVTTTPTPDEDAPATGVVFGADLYYGTSNLSNAHRYRDGFWLGYGPAYPSNLYATYNDKSGVTGKVALSVGKLYNGSISGFDQPIEAYVAKPFGKTTLTAGKFYVPFELAEWEYETELGLQAERAFGKQGALTTAVTYNRIRETPNFYARYARTVGPATVGFSLGGGQGFILDTDHDRGAALDLTVEHGRFRLEGAALLAQKSAASSRFGFTFARLNYQLDPKAKIYVSRHSWHDRLDQEGNGHFSTLGAVYQVSKHLSVEGATSRSGELNRTINWVELHYTIER